ncbi:MAG: serine protease [Elainella sp. Prado103]|nr:serine protease [Elainella sp. Prado103]
MSTEQIYELAQAITVKVFAGNTWGSGILVDKENNTYTVLTSRHLINLGDEYHVQTLDGRVYPAQKLESWQSETNDIEVLKFQGSHASYQLASLGSLTTVNVGDMVFAAGYSFEVELSQPTDFVLTPGQVSLVLDQALEHGYRIGYTNSVAQGMSGGPLLNDHGQVIGVHGMDKYPLWGDPYIFQDGSRPPAELREQMRRLSWAIPAQILMQ